MISDAAARDIYIAPHPEAVALRAETDALREELAKLITDRDYLTTTVLPTIEAEYNLKIGGLEYEAFILECRLRRRRRLRPARQKRNAARLMDAGKLLFAKLTEKSRERRWLKVCVQIFMREL